MAPSTEQSWEGFDYEQEFASATHDIHGVWLACRRLQEAIPEGDATNAGDDAGEAGEAGDDAMDDDDAMEDDAMADGFDLEGRTITVAVENAYLPFNYLDPETANQLGGTTTLLTRSVPASTAIPSTKRSHGSP